MLAVIQDKKDLKKRLVVAIDELIKKDVALQVFFYGLMKRGDLYFVGGFIRDLANGQKSRDIDIITVATADEIQKLIDTSRVPAQRNRHNGFKLNFNQIEIDIWSLSDNWAFKKRVVKFNPGQIESIAKGTFFNFDSLVFNYNTHRISVDYYNRCITSNTLDILQKSSKYRGHNPTQEANILRAFYLQKKYGFQFTENLSQYIKEHLAYFIMKDKNSVSRLEVYLGKYPKYASLLNKKLLEEYSDRMLNGDGFAKINLQENPPLPRLF